MATKKGVSLGLNLDRQSIQQLQQLKTVLEKNATAPVTKMAAELKSALKSMKELSTLASKFSGQTVGLR